MVVGFYFFVLVVVLFVMCGYFVLNEKIVGESVRVVD